MRGTVKRHNFCREMFSGEVTLGVARIENSWGSLIEKSGYRLNLGHMEPLRRRGCDAKHLGNEFGIWFAIFCILDLLSTREGRRARRVKPASPY